MTGPWAKCPTCGARRLPPTDPATPLRCPDCGTIPDLVVDAVTLDARTVGAHQEMLALCQLSAMLALRALAARWRTDATMLRTDDARAIAEAAARNIDRFRDMIGRDGLFQAVDRVTDLPPMDAGPSRA